MSKPLLLLADGDRRTLATRLEQAWRDGCTTAITTPQEAALLAAALPAEVDPAWGAAVVLGTGGSSGARRWCLQPLAHLQVAVDATAHWLREIHLDPARLELFNPLPLQHVSGLMPLLRARRWGAVLHWLSPEQMRQPECLPPAQGEAVISLVPIQLQRLLESQAGQRWLAGFSVIWVGGAALPAALAQQCRRLGLRLAPCYGSTETGAMVAALAPHRFLAGIAGCGHPMPHAQLRLDSSSGSLQIKAPSLGLGCLEAGQLQPLPLHQGWLSSGDRARLTADGWHLEGRLDGAIQSGAETVFPDQVEQRLLALSRSVSLPLAELLLLPEPDPLWGERLVALVKPAAVGADVAQDLLAALAALALELPPSQRPRRWLLCPALERTALGKWERGRWRGWLVSQAAATP